jgi:hypothetical protein
MADELKIFQAGDKITAEETNDNNRYLLSAAQDTSGELQQYIETQLNQFQNTLNAQISSINAQISAANANINNLNNSKLSAELYGNSIRFSNGLIIQWGFIGGMGNGTVATITLPRPFPNGVYAVAGAASYEQTRGDKGSTWRAYDFNTTWFHLQSHFEQWAGAIWWIAIGW